MALATLISPTAPATPADDVSVAIAGMIERVKPSVVQVRNAGHGAGAGVIWRASGDIITNHHVVAHESRSIEVLLPDDRAFEAQVVGHNPRLDLALLHIEARDLPAAPAGESARLRVGDLVFAVGHPWGQRWTTTAGIISGLGTLPGRDGPARYLRSDVLLRPGNSGGPLLNARGAVIGINAMIFGGDLSVAIPSDTVTAWVNNLAGRRIHLGVGVQPVQLTGEPAAGLLVVGIEPGGPAERAGLLVGDVLLAGDGHALAEPDTLLDILAASDGRTPLRLEIGRAGARQALEIVPSSPEPGV